MRVLLVNKFWYPKGGSERYTFLLKDLLESHGHEVIPFAMEDERNMQTPWSTHFVSHVDFWDATDAVPNQTSFIEKCSRVLWSREAARKIGEVIDEVKPDIAHLQNFTHQISPSILPMLRRRHVPVVWTLHDLDVFLPGYRHPGDVRRRALAWMEHVLHHGILDVYRKHIQMIIAPSRFAADVVRTWGWKGRIEVVTNFLPITVRNPSQPPLSQKGGGGAVLFVGRLVKEKGILDFLETAKRLPDIVFEVIGGGPFNSRFSAQGGSPPKDGQAASGGQIPDSRFPNVRWLGALSFKETAQSIARAAVVVVPSTIPENAPYVILEAMAAGVLVVASRIGGIPELVREGETGFLVPPGDAVTLAKTIDMVYRDQMLRKRLGVHARSIVADTYGHERHYQQLIGIYGALRGSPPS